MTVYTGTQGNDFSGPVVQHRTSSMGLVETTHSPAAAAMTASTAEKATT